MVTRRDASGRDGGEDGGGGATPLTDGEGRLLIPIETLGVLNWLGETGLDGVESRLGRVLADAPTVEAEQVKIDHVGPETAFPDSARKTVRGASSCGNRSREPCWCRSPSGARTGRRRSCWSARWTTSSPW